MSTTTFNETLLAGPAPLREAETIEPNRMDAIVSREPRGIAAEQFRVLRYRIECLAAQGYKALAFTSAQSGEGKTTTAINLAMTLARGGRNRVALVDLDLRRPAIAERLGLHAATGLCDVVRGVTRLDETLWQFGREGLYVLPAGRVPEDLGTILYHPNLSELLSELKTRFDFVLVDTPPILPLADVPTLCNHLDGAVMVVRAAVTSRELVEAATAALPSDTLRGLVLNDVDPAATLTLNLYNDPQTRALPAPR